MTVKERTEARIFGGRTTSIEGEDHRASMLEHAMLKVRTLYTIAITVIASKLLGLAKIQQSVVPSETLLNPK